MRNASCLLRHTLCKSVLLRGEERAMEMRGTGYKMLSDVYRAEEALVGHDSYVQQAAY